MARPLNIMDVFFGRKSMLTGAQQQYLTNFVVDMIRTDVSICRI